MRLFNLFKCLRHFINNNNLSYYELLNLFGIKIKMINVSLTPNLT